MVSVGVKLDVYLLTLLVSLYTSSYVWTYCYITH